MTILGRLPLPLGVALVAAVTVAVIALGSYFGLGFYVLALLALPVVLAVLYLREYSRKELRPKPTKPLTGPEEEGPPSGPADVEPPLPAETTLTLFDDAVLEASLRSAGSPSAVPGSPTTAAEA